MTNITHHIRTHALLDILATDIEDATSVDRVQCAAGVLLDYITSIPDTDETLRQVGAALESVILDFEGEDIDRSGRIGYLLDMARGQVARAIEDAGRDRAA
jgi:hypothetical protein